ncbi:bifunctional hydroxymethylpyrimidine kinase/phosphomethylpyrimidine kinase [Oceanobacillus profundus]|uniref:Hydroxymethylpyrimidine/phosphomethylpyrimidine kinase n=1 Tax=Oceanobacillus profundus TaxID=372463 RepID=A0A417YED9_9BACI|nr:bifunctional hydroxymethylpyrimidine kinase/phosphomethylpyrimidine kinase [Oceanobacillus profundus]MDO6450631.1 bifunctional hydroxymethylpyrimidine kinase/phosphomethylpyrimidine kinase [Oceanobacillus profundus]PAE28509.1 bifunctional hydroxymethylpyrimidine kinase/phosphomethylpyrimidine kinase [Paenibacillus sp. 7884-2]RHW31022.1 bifunctional hydroxymethylpyrimidine kinase/phosphomethylpyrimidine kinase [Oceanobacillus profundus]
MNYPVRVMTIAGSAAGGSAGIQADLKTFEELDVYGMSIITAIVGRHPETNKNVHLQSVEAIEAQFSTAINQVGADGVKTGMLFSKEVIEVVARLIRKEEIQTVVVDPVMIGKMNSKLLKDDAIEELVHQLIPMATIITPNVPEASILLGGRELNTVEDLKQAAIDLHKLGAKSVLVKGGRLEGPAVDVLFNGTALTTFTAPRIDTVNTSGAGCTYSAAITANLTKGQAVAEAVGLAKSFVTTAIEHGFSYTDIVGPTFHAASRKFGEAHPIKIETLT